MFDVKKIDQSTLYIQRVKSSFYDQVHDVSKKKPIMRLMGLPVGLVYAFLRLAQAVTIVAEPIIKGITNILGAFVNRNCKIGRGIKQLCIGVFNPLNSAWIVVQAALEPAISTIGMLVTARRYTGFVAKLIRQGTS